MFRRQKKMKEKLKKKKKEEIKLKEYKPELLDLIALQRKEDNWENKCSVLINMKHYKNILHSIWLSFQFRNHKFDRKSKS